MSIWRGLASVTNLCFSSDAASLLAGIGIASIHIDSICIQILPSIHCILAICVNSVRVRVKANSNSKSQLQSPFYHQGEEGRRRSSVETDIASASLFHSLFVYIVNRCIYRCFRWVNFRVNDMIVEVEDEDVCFPVELNGRRPAV